ncbi:MAG: hypothetical protein IH987_20040 [Planctomycetes bacterium]|nr:hypothetical protein [Planctomycetota bacterium]
MAFTRLLGYVRYFHPSSEAARTDWNAFTVSGVRAVEPAATAAELVSALDDLFHPIAPTVRIFEAGHAPAVPAELMPPAGAKDLKLVAWKHHGLGGEDSRSIYVSERIRRKLRAGKIPIDMWDPATPFTADLGGGVACAVPLALYAEGEGTIPKAAGSPTQAAGATPKTYTGDDRSTRLAAVAICWNVMQHFYPYFDVVDTDWPAALDEALTAGAIDKDKRAFHSTLQRMIAKLDDGHGRVSHAGYSANFTLPLLWDWVEGQLVITRVQEAGDVGGLEPGDVVLEIDGQTAGQALAEVEQLISAATDQYRRYRGLRRLAASRESEGVDLAIQDASGRRRTVTLHRTNPFPKLKERKPPVVHEIEPGIIYLDFNRITDIQFTDALAKLEKAKGIVFDFRGYPGNIGFATFFPHIIDGPAESPQWHIPVVRRPDRQAMGFERGGDWNLRPKKPFLNAKKAFIINGRCISYAESCLGIIAHYKLGAIVGSPTAGTNGNVNPFPLPGGYTVMWTGMKVLTQDGARHHGIGILPTVPVARTIAGIRAGRDEFLEKALEIVRGP